MNTRMTTILTALLIFSLIAYSENRYFKHIRIGNKVFTIDENDTLQIKKHLEKQSSIINAIDSVAFGENGIYGKLKQPASTDSSEVIINGYDNSHFPKLKYEMRKSFGRAEYGFWGDNSVSSLTYTYDNRYTPAREVLENLRNSGAGLSAYPIISERVAVQRAVALLNTIMGVENAKMFDSMRVTVDAKGYMNMSYLIQFVTKIKNDIEDGSFVFINIYAYDGKIDSYRGANPQLCKEDFDYKPKVAKQTVLDMFLSECSKSNIKIEVSQIALHKIRSNPECWHWRIFGFDKDRPGSIALILFVDSETGEVVKKSIR